MYNIFIYICLLHFLLMTLFYFYVCVPVFLCAVVHMWRSENSLQESIPFPHRVDPGDQTETSGLAAIAFTH